MDFPPRKFWVRYSIDGKPSPYYEIEAKSAMSAIEIARHKACQKFDELVGLDDMIKGLVADGLAPDEDTAFESYFHVRERRIAYSVKQEKPWELS